MPDSFDAIPLEIEVSQRWALPQHSCKTLCPGLADLIAVEIEVSKRWALWQNSCKTLCPRIADIIVAEIEVSQRCTMRQHSCKSLSPILTGLRAVAADREWEVEVVPLVVGQRSVKEKEWLETLRIFGIGVYHSCWGKAYPFVPPSFQR